MNFIEYLIEKRKNPLLNPKINKQQLIEKYKNDEDVYISYRSIDKIGINPNSKWKTPNGIYTYPLKQAYELYFSKGKDVPFASEQPYLYFIKVKPEYKDNLLYVDSYSKNDYNKDLTKLKDKFNLSKEEIKRYQGIHPGNDYETMDYDDDGFPIYLEKEMSNLSPINKLMNITRWLSQPGDKHIEKVGNPNKWTLIFLKVLNYYGIVDKKGMGIIHKNEPMQAVFFTTKAFTVIDTKYDINVKTPTDAYIALVNDDFKDEKVKKQLYSILFKDAYTTYMYAKDQEKKFPEGEKIIAKNAKYSYLYALNILNGPFKQGEAAISKHPEYSYRYAYYVLNSRFPEGEPAIKQDPKLWHDYTFFILDRDDNY